MGDDGIAEGGHTSSRYFLPRKGDFFECAADEGEKAVLYRFAAAGAAIRYRAVQEHEVEDIVTLDIALRRNDEDWFEALPPEIEKALVHKFYCGHFFCHVFHHDYIVAKGSDYREVEERMRELLDRRGAEIRPNTMSGTCITQKPGLVSHYKELDPCNAFSWSVTGFPEIASFAARCACDRMMPDFR